MKISAQKLLDFFVEIAPEFRKFWDSEDNFSIDDDGSFNFHSVCTEFSHYFRDQVAFKEPTLREKTWTQNIEEIQLQKLFNFIEGEITPNGGLNGELDNALCTCFLEYIAQSKAGHYARQFMGENSQSYFDKWNV